MNDILLTAIVGVITGAAGYWIANFWMQPILNYRALRSRVHADFIFYAQVVNANGFNQRLQDLYEQRIVSNRRNSAELAACAADLPRWYKQWLKFKGQNPELAITNLIGFSNTTDYEAAAKHAAVIRRALGIAQEV